MQRRAVAVQVLDERDDAALVAELVLLPAALVADVDAQPRVQERELAEALREHVELVLGLREDLRVGQERDARAGLVGGADLLERRLRLAAPVGLAPDRAAAPDLELEPLGERVHDRHAHAVQTARDLVGAVVELAARVERGHHHFGGGPLLGGVLVDGNSAPVVGHGHAAVLVQDHVDLLAEARDRLVDRVVDDLVDEVVKTLGARRADVHRGPFADRVEAFEHLDGTGVVAQIAEFPGLRRR